jgi:hypothetical protein
MAYAMKHIVKSINRLEKAGLARPQAEIVIETIETAVAFNFDAFATKADLQAETAQLRHEMHQGFTETKAEFAAVRAEMNTEFAAVRSEMNAEFAAVRSEMNAEFAAVRSEMSTGFTAVRSEMSTGFAAVRSEMSTGFAAVRSEMSTGFATVRSEMNANFSRIDVNYAKLQAGFSFLQRLLMGGMLLILVNITITLLHH